MKGGNIPNLAKNLQKIDNDMVDAYIHAAYTAARYKNFDRFKGVNGIVFSGNHDGNVIVMYKNSALAYCYFYALKRFKCNFDFVYQRTLKIRAVKPL